MSETSPYANGEYTIGWICPLPIEMAAAKGMLDEQHGEPQDAPKPPDTNAYYLGRVGNFRVVIAGLPLNQYGPSSATKVSENMLQTFPNVRIGFLIGVGGGIPHQASDRHQNVRLGDVVISGNKTGGVVWYEFGKLLDGTLHQRYALNQPPMSIGTALTKMEAEHESKDNRIKEYVI